MVIYFFSNTPLPHTCGSSAYIQSVMPAQIRARARVVRALRMGQPLARGMGGRPRPWNDRRSTNSRPATGAPIAMDPLNDDKAQALVRTALTSGAIKIRDGLGDPQKCAESDARYLLTLIYLLKNPSKLPPQQQR